MNRREAITLMAGTAVVLAAGSIPRAAGAAMGKDAEDQLFDILRNDHSTVKKLINQLSDKNTSAQQRTDLFAQLKKALLPHMKAEEATLYPALLKQQKEIEPAAMAVEEHHAASAVFNDLDTMDKNDPRFVPAAMVLKELLDHHIKEEESKVFEATRKVFKKDSPEMQNLLSSFQAEKQKAAQAI